MVYLVLLGILKSGGDDDDDNNNNNARDWNCWWRLQQQQRDKYQALEIMRLIINWNTKQKKSSVLKINTKNRDIFHHHELQPVLCK